MKGVEKQIKGNRLTHLHVFTCTSCYLPPIKILHVCEDRSLAAKIVISYSFVAETRSWGTISLFVVCSEAY